jgi:hypothetical protein
MSLWHTSKEQAKSTQIH